MCDGRDMKDMLPSIPNYYEYGSELIFHYKHVEGSEEHWHHIVSPRNNWFDQEMQVCKREIVLLNLLDTVRLQGWITSP